LAESEGKVPNQQYGVAPAVTHRSEAEQWRKACQAEAAVQINLWVSHRDKASDVRLKFTFIHVSWNSLTALPFMFGRQHSF